MKIKKSKFTGIIKKNQRYITSRKSNEDKGKITSWIMHMKFDFCRGKANIRISLQIDLSPLFPEMLHGVCLNLPHITRELIICISVTEPSAHFLQNTLVVICVTAKASWLNYFSLRLFDLWYSWICFREVSQWCSAWESWCGIMEKALFGSTVPRRLC